MKLSPGIHSLMDLQIEMPLVYSDAEAAICAAAPGRRLLTLISGAQARISNIKGGTPRPPRRRRCPRRQGSPLLPWRLTKGVLHSTFSSANLDAPLRSPSLLFGRID